MIRKCVICTLPLSEVSIPGEHGVFHHINCVRCGEYLIEHKLTYPGNTLISDGKLCALINKYRVIHGRDVFIHTQDFDRETLRRNEEQWDAVELNKFRSEWPVDVPDLLELAFFLFVSHYKKMGEHFQVDEIRAISWGLLSDSEYSFAFTSWISNGYINWATHPYVYIKTKGWEYLSEIKRKSIVEKKLKQVFVAMSFGTDEVPIYELAIKPAIEACGYTPMIIRDKHYNDGVMDNIIAEIRKSRFVIADYTGNKRGVYYEAGFAFGLGLEVVKCVDEKQLNVEPTSDQKLHFDVQHINFIARKDYENLRNRLISRIKAMNL